MRPPSPSQISAKTAVDGDFALQALANGRWAANGVEVQLNEFGGGLEVVLTESKQPIFHLLLEWHEDLKGEVLGDAWERAYGDLEWRPANAAKAPWYFFHRDGAKLELYGVRTGGAAMAEWTLELNHQSLKLDLRSGHRPLHLESRTLRTAVIIRATNDGDQSALLKTLCPQPMLAKQAVYGINDWYYAYGNNTAANILEDTKRASEWAGSHRNRPFSVIDMGWSRTEADWSAGNAKFPDMPGLAAAIQKEGCRPGLWMRPLQTDANLPKEWFLVPGILDPSQPEVLQKVHDDVFRIHGWGYELIKHDFSTFDVCGLWGFQMTEGIVGKDRTFADQKRTTAEILHALYRTIRDAAGNSLVIGCNTVGHLAAGLEEIQRIGDDTSGREWARTVKMGVNSLAYRGCQQGAFYEADPDCVGITPLVAWERTERWLDLAAHSGTVLFVSAQKEALGVAQHAALKRAFDVAAKRQPLAVPTSGGLAPIDWVVDGKRRNFDWS